LIQSLIKSANKEETLLTVQAIAQYASVHCSEALISLFIVSKFEDKCKGKIVIELVNKADAAIVASLVQNMQKQVMEKIEDVKEARYIMEKLYYIMSHSSNISAEIAGDYCKWLLFLSLFNTTLKPSKKSKVMRYLE
jgi:hypothetical protein